MKAWHTQSTAETLAALESDAQHGLTENMAAQRLAQEGRNELIDCGTKSPWAILREQLTGVIAAARNIPQPRGVPAFLPQSLHLFAK